MREATIMKEYCKCGKPNRKNYYSCAACHAASCLRYAKLHPLSPEARRKSNARSYSYWLLRRGKLAKKPCEVCGEVQVQMHHPDYNDRYRVRWLCKEHHHQLHKLFPPGFLSNA